MRRVWSELVPYERLRRREVLRPLAERGVSLLVAVTPADVEGLPEVIASAADAGVEAGVWPMLERSDGRWPNARNAVTFGEQVRRLFDRLDARGLSVHALAVDLEPPIEELRRLLGGDVRVLSRWVRRGGLARATRAFDAVAGDVRARGVPVLAAVIPSVIGTARAGRGWQRALGTPIDGVSFDRVSPMAYTSMFEGYSRRIVRREDAVSLLAVIARHTARRYGARASLSLGAIGPGILGDEPTFRSVTELAEDVAQARAAGISDLAVFDLSGMLARPPVERWLDALVYTEPAARSSPLTPRAAAVALAVRLGGVSMDLGNDAMVRAWGRRSSTSWSE